MLFLLPDHSAASHQLAELVVVNAAISIGICLIDDVLNAAGGDATRCQSLCQQQMKIGISTHGSAKTASNPLLAALLVLLKDEQDYDNTLQPNHLSRYLTIFKQSEGMI